MCASQHTLRVVKSQQSTLLSSKVSYMGAQPDSSLKTQTCVLIDTCEPLFGYQIIETLDSKKLGFPWEIPWWEGKKKSKTGIQMRQELVSREDSQLVRFLTGKTGIETVAERTTPLPRPFHGIISCLLFKLSPHPRSLEMDSRCHWICLSSECSYIGYIFLLCFSLIIWHFQLVSTAWVTKFVLYKSASENSVTQV